MSNNVKRNKISRMLCAGSTVNPVRNCRNNQYVDFDDNMKDHIRYISSTKHAFTVMFFGLVCSNGEVLPPILFDSGYQLNTNRYNGVLTLTIITWMRKVAGVKKFVFQQDGAPAHMANKTLAFLKKIDFWPLASPEPRP